MRSAKKIAAAILLFGICAGSEVGRPGAFAAEIDKTKLPAAAMRTIDFAADIAPIFSKHCYSCHGPEKQKNNFRLDLKAAALKGGDDFAPDILPGKSADSPLIHFVSGLVEDKLMPKKGDRLSSEQIGLLRAWIDQGANWPDDLSALKPQLSTNNWAFQPLTHPAPPTVKNKSWPRSVIDRFILARLEEKGISPAPAADKLTLLRRVTFDLHGLPPTPAELDAFLADKSPQAFANVVDRLLASPRYGERWGRHWLDVVRYGESHGFERDQIRDNAWRYRDYVIESFNRDMPYAQFVKEQIAGDALDPLTAEGITATGFLVCGPWDEVGNGQVSTVMKARVREEELEDVIAVVGQTFLGVTINCARCHDHKFDPIPQVDYYRMKATFEGVRHGDRPLATPAEASARTARLDEINRRIRELETKVAAIEQAGRERVLHVSTRAKVSGKPALAPTLPVPVSRWTFEKDARDSLGALHGTLLGGASVTNGRLRLDGKGAFVRTATLPSDIREKTLEAWIALPDLAQRGGGVISLESKTGDVFDAIVYGERVPKKWIAGSSSFERTKDLSGPDETTNGLVHVAVVYRGDNSIAVYRNGAPYDKSYVPSGANGTLRTYAANDSQVLFGLRHTGAGHGFLAGEIEEARLYDRALSAEEIAASAQALGPAVVTPAELVQALTKEERPQRESFLAEISRQRAALKAVPAVPQVYAVNSRKSEPTFVLARGDVEKKRDPVTAGGLSAVAAVSAEFGLAADGPEETRRIKLAEWITSPQHPLTWRVLVNRVWHYHFGRGIVGTPNDFGVNGERPSHPELLDFLATEFLKQGGSIKKLHRLILLSSTYQQSPESNEKAAALDADNRLLWRYPLRRLEGEAIRDAVLSVSGDINYQSGGPGFRPFTVFVNNSHFYTLTDPTGPEFNRRTVYRINVQSARDPLLSSLDCPDPSTKTPARSITTTPIQALGMMNNAFVQRQARSFAKRLQAEAGVDSREQIQLAYRLAFGRKPSASETNRAIALAHEHGMESVCWTLFNASEFFYVR